MVEYDISMVGAWYSRHYMIVFDLGEPGDEGAQHGKSRRQDGEIAQAIRFDERFRSSICEITGEESERERETEGESETEGGRERESERGGER